MIKKAKDNLFRQVMADHGGTVLQPEQVPQPGHPSTKLFANPAQGLSPNDDVNYYA